jgi:hypothetical protein
VAAAVQILVSVIDASSSSNNRGGSGTQDQQQQQQRGSVNGKAGSSSQLPKGSKKKQSSQAKAAAAAALEDKPFAKRRQQQQQKAQSGTASQGTVGAGAGAGAATVAAVDNMLAVLESVLQYVLPAAVIVLPAAAEEAAAAQQGLPAQQQQQQLGVFVGLLQGVQQLLLALMSSGKLSWHWHVLSASVACNSSAEPTPIMQPLARHHLLGRQHHMGHPDWLGAAMPCTGNVGQATSTHAYSKLPATANNLPFRPCYRQQQCRAGDFS